MQSKIKGGKIEEGKIFCLNSYPKWKHVIEMDKQTFSSLSLEMFQEFLNWEPFFIKVEEKKVGPICLKTEFHASAHTFEPFTIKTHSLEVLKQCYNQSRFYSLEGILSFECFSLLLLFHDIGKNISVLWSGSKKNQHFYTVPILQYVLERKSLSHWFPLFNSVIHMDPLGSFLKGLESRKNIEKMIKTASQKAKKSLNHFFQILEFYYFCDASAYTNLRKKIFTHTFGGKMLLTPQHSRYEEFLYLKKNLMCNHIIE